jgi:hypothetical protein
MPIDDDRDFVEDRRDPMERDQRPGKGCISIPGLDQYLDPAWNSNQISRLEWITDP